jgi:ankyrin repeat protein
MKHKSSHCKKQHSWSLIKCVDQHKIDVNSQNEKQETPLHLAASVGYVNDMDYVIDFNIPC